MTALSSCELWGKMQEYYNKIGPDAWHDEVVPSQISSNKLLATQYAEIIFCHILDTLSTNPEAAKNPFYIVEIGAGHGKFSFYCMKVLNEILQRHNYEQIQFIYVMTDISRKNVDSWLAHPSFKPWIQQGKMDCAEYNAMESGEIDLILRSQKLTKGSLLNPVFMICNYLFDSLPHDAFQIRNHALYQASLQISSKATGQQYFEKAEFKFEHTKISSDYYPDPSLNNILKDYIGFFDKASFLIPTGAVQCLRNIEQLSQAHMLLLVADKGESNRRFFEGLDDPDISVHGSVSLMVNFDAIARLYQNQHGTAMLMPNQACEFQVACYCSRPPQALTHTRLAYERAFSHGSPQDIINLGYREDEINSSFSTLDELIALLNIGAWDPNLFCDLHEMVLEQIEDNDITVEQDNNLLYGAQLAWDYFFKLEKSQDLPFAIAGLYYALDEFELAQQFYQCSIDLFGENSDNLYNMALSFQMLADNDAAIDCANKSLKIDPEYELARELLRELG